MCVIRSFVFLCMPTGKGTLKAYQYQRLLKAKLFIDLNFRGEIDLDTVAFRTHTSKFHFLRQFKTTYGLTPHQYLTKRRMNEARTMLAKGEGISQTCYALGYSSLSSFTKLFTQNVGLKPSEYVRREQLKAQHIAQNPLQMVPASYIAYLHWDK